MDTAETIVFSEKQLRTWAELALGTTSMPQEEKDIIADLLITTNLRGVDTHGINLLSQYVQRYNNVPRKPITIVKDNKASAMMDGGDNLGGVVSVRAMELAMKKADEHDIGLVLVRNSAHFGAAAYFTQMAAQKGYIGFCTTTALVNLAPWGGFTEIAGKNPFSISFPGRDFPIVLDIACSVAARQKVIACAREGKPIPLGWAIDKEGNPTTDAKAALEGIFLPFAEHKGIGIAMMIEFCIACLCKTGYSYDVKTDVTQRQNIAHIFVALDPGVFLSKEEMDKESGAFSDKFHACQKLPGVEKLYLPGELEWDTYQARKISGVPLKKALVKEIDAYADSIGIPRLSDC